VDSTIEVVLRLAVVCSNNLDANIHNGNIHDDTHNNCYADRSYDMDSLPHDDVEHLHSLSHIKRQTKQIERNNFSQ